MPPLSSVLAFAAVSALLIAIPGPSVLFVIGRSLSMGRRGGLLSVLGNELGALPLVVAVSLGVGAVVAQSVVVFTVIKLIGAGYLVYLGVQAIRHRHIAVETSESRSGRREAAWKTIAQGFVVGISNPKTIVFFVAVLPQFVDYHGASVPLQMIALGVVFLTIAFISDAIWALIAGTARAWFASSPKRMSRLRAAGGGMMIALGGTLVASGSKA